MERFEDILAECIEEIKADRCSLKECLHRYPSLRHRLEPLLRVALEIPETPDVEPSPSFKLEARVWLMDEISQGQAVAKWPWSRCSSHMGLSALKRRFSMVGVVIAVVLTLSAAGGGTAYASQNSLPGDTLYPVKLVTEQVRMVLPGDDTAKAEMALSFADTRIEEIEALAEKGRAEDLGLAAEEYSNSMDRVRVRLERAAAGGLATGNVTARVAEATSKHLCVLDRVYDAVPDQAKPAIALSRNVSQMGHLRAIDALSRDQLGPATEINLAAMEERLNRAATAAQTQDVGEVENALARYEEMSQLGSRISAHGRQLGGGEAAAVGELVAGATHMHLFVLDEIADTAPGEALQAVARARYEALTRHREGLTELSVRDPVEATEINLRAMAGRLDRIAAVPDNSQAMEVALDQLDNMAELSEEISRISRQAGTDIDRVDELLAEATSVHVEVLADVWERVPEQARDALERVMARALIRHEDRIQAMEQRGVHLPGHPGIPPHVRERVEEKMRQQRIWDEREAALSPGIPGGAPGCPGCRRP